jgi:Fur family ferric uptake transcriptional regulator
MTSPSLLRAVTARLRDHGVRLTPGRRELVEALTEADGPRSAAELFTAIGDTVPLSSLYRSLSTLEGAGVVEPHNAVRGVTRYELAEWLRGHHHHLICVDCGVVEDVALPEHREDEVRRLVTEIGSEASFSTVGHALEIEGRCARCA